MNILLKLLRYKEYLVNVRKINDPNQILWFENISKIIDQTFFNMYSDEYLFESRIKNKDKFIAKYHKSLTDNKTSSNIDIFGIRITGNFWNSNYVAEVLLDQLNGIISNADKAIIHETQICDIGSFPIIQFRNISLEIQIMTPELRNYVNQTHAEYDQLKYGIIPNDGKPPINL